MSADTTPIAPARFASALKDLSIGMLHLKVLEIRNSIAHLEYSNDQLRPYANGTAVASPKPSTSPSNGTAAAPDQDCIDAISENEQVIERMHERIALVRAEVEERGASWTEFERKEDLESKHPDVAAATAATATQSSTSTSAAVGSSNPWTDGTFQTGTIRNGEVQFDDIPGAGAGTQQQSSSNGTATGGSLSDDQLRAAMEERMRQLQGDDEEGMHL